MEAAINDLEGPSTLFVTSLGLSLDSVEVQASIQYCTSVNSVSEICVAIRENCQILHPYTDSPNVNFEKKSVIDSHPYSWKPESDLIEFVRERMSLLHFVAKNCSSTDVNGLIFHRNAKMCHKLTPQFH